MRAPGHQRIVELEARLIEPDLDAEVDMVLSSVGTDRYRVASLAGSVEFVRVADVTDDGRGHLVEQYRYEIVELRGIDPIADTTDDRFIGLDAETEGRFPTRDVNAYPHAHDQIAQFFDSPHAPDLVAQHTPGHHFETNLGEHGSLGVVQARAPFIVSGAGVPAQGLLPRSARMVDVAPTILRLLGGDVHPAGVGPTGAPRPGALLARQDGDPLISLVEDGGAQHVVLILLDGCNANVLYDAIASGAAPAIGALAASGTTLERGVLASLPTATLANHTTASTGVHPGHSGVLHNMWLDRGRQVTPDLLAMDQMFDAMVHLRPDVETVHQAIHRSRPEAFTAALFEFCDTGADVSSFADFRAGRPPTLPDSTKLPDVAADFVATSGAYAFMSSVDERATRQAIALWERREGTPLPDFTFLSLALTDEAGHEGGPHAPIAAAAIADSDRRVERVIDAVDRSGARDRTAFVVIADHGMEANDRSNSRPWGDLVADVTGGGDDLVDVASGLIYLR